MKNSEYSVSELSKISGVSVRTLHLYDEIGLLKPATRTEGGYRRYGEVELLRLQQILLYRDLNFPLSEIKRLLDDPDFDLLHALEGQNRPSSSDSDKSGTCSKRLTKPFTI